MEHALDVFTMGFSNRSWEDTVEILANHHMQRLVDIRTLPGSRRTPQFNLENLEQKLPEAGVEYLHLKSLGGLRKPIKDSTLNAAWKNDGFRAYADYMQSAEFQVALAELMAAAKTTPTAIMCSEALPQKCHRRIISDALVVHGWQVRHLLSPKRIDDHPLTPFAHVEGETITYPAETLF